MKQNKYSKYIIQDYQPVKERKYKGATGLERILRLGDDVLAGSMYTVCGWIAPGEDGDGPPAHTHDFDEIIGFIGTNQQNHKDLGGEVEFWMDDEKYVMTNTFIVFVPKGLKHLPMKVRNVTSPIFHFTVGGATEYLKSNGGATEYIES